jgi:hypothetical protein
MIMRKWGAGRYQSFIWDERAQCLRRGAAVSLANLYAVGFKIVPQDHWNISVHR